MEKSLSIVNIAVFTSALLILLLWIFYVSKHSFEIVLPGLRSFFRIWVLHLCNLVVTIVIFATILPHVHDFLLGQEWFCLIFPRIWRITFSINFYSVTIFTYQKAKMYFEMFASRFERFFSRFVHYVGMLLYITSVLFTKSITDVKNEDEDLRLPAFFVLLCAIHYLICNGVVVCIILRYSQKIKENLPAWEPQFEITERFLLLLIYSDFVIFLVPIIFITISTVAATNIINLTNTIVLSITWIIVFLDSVLNNAIMHYTVFAHVQYIDEEQAIRAAIENDPDHIVEESEEAEERFYWISLSGLQPIRVSENLVRENDLWNHVITDAKMLQQIERFKRMSCFFTLYWACRTDDELLKIIEIIE